MGKVGKNRKVYRIFINGNLGNKKAVRGYPNGITSGHIWRRIYYATFK
ncbi:hypothetical protein X808_17880 [Mannheimia varigena USDA-ARS-USMARC-1296]|uniref:Uncharacterized protein n=1 Tax=Mannheimia varigena USDA-ARS-USMARC-1296 TaxID=1433287 RepID=W0QGF7_9PAST|nr:hypothetical protein X808_17880 [Mannheimia varigena USDA-ARS-USMARC-1296]